MVLILYWKYDVYVYNPWFLFFFILKYKKHVLAMDIVYKNDTNHLNFTQNKNIDF